MQFIPQSLKDVFIIEPKVMGDHRGYFMESFRQDLFNEHVGKTIFIQDNESFSSYGVFRGLHFQSGEHSQAKLVRVLQGSVLDVIVDLRQNSPTFKQYLTVELSADNKKQLFVPRGFAHGFLVTSETALFCYKVDNIYHQPSEMTLRYDDPTIGIEWPYNMTELKISEKDRLGLFFEEISLF